MNEYEALRREIEVRIQRETAYMIERLKYEVGNVNYAFLTERINKNDEIIAEIGAFLLEKGSEWEKRYREKFPR